MNDLISRQALCEYALNQKDKSVTPNDIMRFPSAQPELIAQDAYVRGFEQGRTQGKVDADLQQERKTEKWINEGRIIRCSKCKIGYATVKGMKSALTYNFCPNCGAKMEGILNG